MSLDFLPSVTVETQLAVPGTWADEITNDLAADLRLQYGIQGNGPLNRMAGIGELGCSVFNDADNAGSTLGWYSPVHASKRSGWDFDIPVRVVFTRGSTASVTSITRSGSTATVTTASAHGRSTGDYVTIAGATQSQYNGTFQITVTSGSTFTYTVSGTPATPATGAKTWIRAFVKFRGRIRVILPDPGAYGPRRVHVTAYDPIRELSEEDVRAVALQINKTEVQVLDAVLNTMPTDSQPPARDFDTAVDTYAVALDDLQSGRKVLAVINDLMISTFGLGFSAGDGTLRYLSRHSMALATSQFTFDNNMHGLVVPSSLDKVYRLARTQNNPRSVSPTAMDILYEIPTGTTIPVPAFDTIEFWTDYTDPNDETRKTPIGGAEVVEVLVAGVHYAANSAEDGSGSDLTTSITPTIDPFASTAKWTLQNTGSVTAYMTLLRPIGKAARNPGPQFFEAETGAANRPIKIDLRYQDDPSIGQGVADHVIRLYGGLTQQIEAIEFLANYSDEYLLQALEREIGDVITISEEVTGLDTVDAEIRSIELRYENDGASLWCKWGLAPASAQSVVWQLGVAGASELGVTTYLGF